AELGHRVTGEPPGGFQFLNRSREVTLPETTYRHRCMRTGPIGVQGEQFLQKLNTGVHVSAHAESKPRPAVDDGTERVERQGTLQVGDGLGTAPLRFAKDAEPLVRGGVIWIQLDGTAVFCFSSRPIPVLGLNRAQGGMRLSESSVQLDGLQRRGLRS